MEVQTTRAGTRRPGVRTSYSPSHRPDLLVLRFVGSEVGPHALAPLANSLSAYLFGYLNGYKIPTQFVERIDETASLVRRIEMFPLKARIWNVAAGSYAKRLGVEPGLDLPFPVPEYFYRPGDRPEALVNEFHLLALGAVTPEQLRIINRLVSKTNAVLRSHLERHGLKLISVACAFGAVGGQIMLALHDDLDADALLISDLHVRPSFSPGPFTLDMLHGPASYRLLHDRLMGREGE